LEAALAHPPSTRLIRLREVLPRVGLGKTAVYARISTGEFPKPVDLGGVVAWVESEVDAWIESKIASRDSSR
jgi:prophage regulatory protein